MSEEKEAKEVTFNLERVYVKDVSFEAPGSPQSFLEQGAPTINISMNINHNLLSEDDGVYEVTLGITAEAKRGDKTVFLVEVHQGGVFTIKDIDEAEMEGVLEITCPNILLPFAREAINDFVCKGGFSQLLINPVNFEALYIQKQEKLAQKGSASNKPATV